MNNLFLNTAKTVKRGALVGTIAISATALLLTGCGEAPPATGGSEAGTQNPAAADFLGCIVSDSGGFDDQSFNQSSYEGMKKSVADLGIKMKEAQSSSTADFAPNLAQMASAGCNLTVTVGFLLADATKEAAKNNPELHYAIIDDNSIEAPNVKPVVYDTAQAAFLAGYVSASVSKTGKVGTFGGINIPTVTIFMDGFADGVKYFNDQKGKDVKVLGWDVATQNGNFTGGFAAGTAAKQAAQGLIDQNADVILPVGGPIYQSAAEAIRDSKKGIVLIGVDADQTQTDTKNADLFLTSIMKGMKPGVEAVTTDAAGGKFENSPFIGTLKNEGVAVAPFHDYASKVDPALQGELDAIKAGIIDGSIKVESPSSPK